MAEPCSTDEILSALSRADDLLEQGLGIEPICRFLGVSPGTYHLWRKAHARTFLATARRLEALEQVHARVLELLTEQQQEIHRLMGLRTQRDTTRLTAVG